MNYIKITPVDVANGPGCRVVLWTAGCEHHCPQCHNQSTWNPASGQLFDDIALTKLIENMSADYIDGITLSGGDPLYPANREKVTETCKILKKKFPNKTIWCYTGYLFEDVKDLEIINYIDVLVDGPFLINKKNLNLVFRGSSNQRLINVPKSLKENKIVLWTENTV